MLWTVAAAVLLINLPFGFWRAGVRKFSPAWFVAVHAPVPLAVGLRFSPPASGSSGTPSYSSLPPSSAASGSGADSAGGASSALRSGRAPFSFPPPSSGGPT